MSYVSAAAELSLRMVRGGHERPNTHAYGQPINALFRVLTGSHALDREKLMGEMSPGRRASQERDDAEDAGADE